MFNFQEWLHNRDKNFHNEVYDVPFDPAMTAGRGGNPVFSRYTGPDETPLPKWMADKGYTSTVTPAWYTPSFEVKEVTSDGSVVISYTDMLKRDLEDQIELKRGTGRNVARIGGEQLLQKNDPNDPRELGSMVSKNAVIFLHDKFGQLKGLLNFYLLRQGYEKAKVKAVPDILSYIDDNYGQVRNFKQYAERIINMSIKSICRDLGLIYDEKNYTVRKNTTGEKMARTERGPSRHQSGIRSHTPWGDKKYVSDYRVDRSNPGTMYSQPIGYIDRSS